MKPTYSSESLSPPLIAGFFLPVKVSLGGVFGSHQSQTQRQLRGLVLILVVEFFTVGVGIFLQVRNLQIGADGCTDHVAQVWTNQ